ncbi:hypothetical protein K2173_000393 [Erythroxylum novogranatense]|uniref:F-box domain-containing protein n=1 Tax=Erythroxylum novogranatense TaxID=1862640 RepID=A0AAV8SWB2_9ROSI|nr:hypothetical protein K2173_000393 [Erythroxylum novogranatense]
MDSQALVSTSTSTQLSPSPQTLQRSGKEVEGCSRNWLELPPDVTASILLRLGAIEILTSAQVVCSTWRAICKEPSMWRSIDMHNLGDLWGMDYDLEKMCRHAVDRSSSGLIDINIEYFGTDDLLHHIFDRSRHLKRLRLVSCYNISDEGLSAVAAKAPLLEELEISYCSFSKETYEVVGRCCPLLKTFKLNCQGCIFPGVDIDCDEEALAIAGNMPELRHLQIFGNQLTNNGLQAILDGCPHLESLDLRQCFNVTLDGSLSKLCAERIKDLRRPYDSTDDYPFDPEVPEQSPAGGSRSSTSVPYLDFLSDYNDDDHGYSDDDYNQMYYDY